MDTSAYILNRGSLICSNLNPNYVDLNNIMSFTSYTSLIIVVLLNFTGPLRGCGVPHILFDFWEDYVPGNCRHAFRRVWQFVWDPGGFILICIDLRCLIVIWRWFSLICKRYDMLCNCVDMLILICMSCSILGIQMGSGWILDAGSQGLEPWS